MRQSMVNRFVLALSGVFVGACIAFAWVVEPGPQPAAASETASEVATETGKAPAVSAQLMDVAAGARLYELRCERCHTLDESLAPLLDPEPGADARAAYLAMLQRHRKSSPAEDGPITDYLQSRLDEVAPAAPESR